MEVSTKNKWIINKRDDLLWLIFSVATCFLVIGIYYFLTKYLMLDEAVSTLVTYMVWAIFFDATHAFATYTRTFFDKEYYQINKDSLWLSFLIFGIGPLLLLIVSLIHKDMNEITATFIIFNRFGLCFAYYHLIRQHWGFISLYRKKSGEIDTTTRKLDGLLLTFGSVYPFLHGQYDRIEPMHISETLSIPSHSWLNVSTYGVIIALLLFLASLTISEAKLIQQNMRIISSISLLVSLIIHLVKNFSLTQVLFYASTFCLASFTFTIVIYLIVLIKNKNVLQYFSDSYPKWLLLNIVVASYNVILHLHLPLYIIIASLTIFHNIQYHKIIDFHNENKYAEQCEEKYGFVVKLTQRKELFLVLALAFNLVSYFPRFAVESFVSNNLFNYVMIAFLWGVSFHHYYLDSIIWKVRDNQQLSASLKM
jgi:hypothetical protein